MRERAKKTTSALAFEAPTIAVLTALPIERSSVMRLIKSMNNSLTRDAEGHAFGLVSAHGNMSDHRVVVTRPGKGQADAAIEACDVIMKFPSISLLVFVGVAGGTKGLRLGDVVVSRRVAHLDEGKREKGIFIFRGYCPEPSADVVKYVESAIPQDKETLQQWNNCVSGLVKSRPVSESFPSFHSRFLGRMPKINLDTIGTSSSIINDPAERDKWRNSEHRVKAFETEAFGISHAAYRYNREYLVIRAISDHSGGDKSDKKDVKEQPYAAHIASACLGLILSQLPPRHLRLRPRRDSVGLFLDVDKTLTADIIQRVYAQSLRCSREFNEIEEDWQKGRIGTQQFNDRMIPLFARHGLTRNRARRIARTVKLLPWVQRLLEIPIDKYFISSGPSYYIHELASQFKIPRDHVLCSKYSFDEHTGLISGCDAVSAATKALFTEGMAAGHLVTVGVGDHNRDDAPFLAKVTIPIMTTAKGSNELKSENFVTAPSHESILNLVLQLTDCFRLESRGNV